MHSKFFFFFAWDDGTPTYAEINIRNVRKSCNLSVIFVRFQSKLKWLNNFF